MELDCDSVPHWITSDLLLMTLVKKNSTPWYNSTLEFPSHTYFEEELEIIDVNNKVINDAFLLNTVAYYKLKGKLTRNLECLKIAKDCQQYRKRYDYNFNDYKLLLELAAKKKYLIDYCEENL